MFQNHLAVRQSVRVMLVCYINSNTLDNNDKPKMDKATLIFESRKKTLTK